MKKSVIGIALGILLIVSMVLTACSSTKSTTSITSTQKPATTTSSVQTSTPVASGKWWDKWGEPQYGGTFNYRSPDLSGVQFDPAGGMGTDSDAWFEPLFSHNMTLDHSVFDYKGVFLNPDYFTGILAESWEQTNPTTITVYLRKGIHWQNIAPVNGREFTADDVQFNFDRILGTGSGYSTPDPFLAGNMAGIVKVTAVDTYTVAFQLAQPTAMNVFNVLNRAGTTPIGAPECARLYGMDFSTASGGGPGGPPGGGGGTVSDQRNSVGTGAFMLQEFINGTSLTCVRNPDYWGYDPRHPENKLPYVDTFKYIAIPDMTTALAAFRTGKIDTIIDMRSCPTWQQVEALKKTNPDTMVTWWPAPGMSVELRCDTKPFTDINVRKALQMAIDRTAIAGSHYGGIVDGTPSGLVNPGFTGFAFTYDQWPEELKAEYSYNTERAKELLAEAGYADGFTTNCVVASEDDTDLLQIIKAEFMDIGVDMTINVMDKPTFMDYTGAGKNDQMALYAATGLSAAPLGALSHRVTKNRDNLTSVSDPDYEALVNQFSTAGTFAEAQQFSQQADRYALEKHWAVNVLPLVSPNIWQPWIKGYDGELAGQSIQICYWYQSWIDQSLKK